jgi:hypothetical protein
MFLTAFIQKDSFLVLYNQKCMTPLKNAEFLIQTLVTLPYPGLYEQAYGSPLVKS